MNANDKIEVKYLYSSYFISNPVVNEFWMLDVPNNKLRMIDAECFEIISEVIEIKEALKGLKDG